MEYFSGGKLYILGTHLPVSVYFSDEFGRKNLFSWENTRSWLILHNVHDGQDANQTSEGNRGVQGTCSLAVWSPGTAVSRGWANLVIIAGVVAYPATTKAAA